MTLRNWLDLRRAEEAMIVTRIQLGECGPWSVCDGVLARPDGRYFSGSKFSGQAWILQPEIGVLGFAVTEIQGRNQILLQAKEEPGNIGSTQIAPTLQATRSNSDKVHGGRSQEHEELFTSKSADSAVIAASLQSEQGTRFWRKRNRNMLIKTKPFFDLGPNHKWFDFQAFRAALGESHTVNTDARSVIASSDWRLFLAGQDANQQTVAPIGKALLQLRNDAGSLHTSLRRLADVRSQTRAKNPSPQNEQSLAEQDAKSVSWGEGATAFQFFHIQATHREINSWAQPLLVSQEILCHQLVVSQHDSQIRFLVRVVSELGLYSLAEFGPTVSSRRSRIPVEVDSRGTDRADFLREYGQVLREIDQSDEGGRFFFETAKYQLLWLEPEHFTPAHQHLFDQSEFMWLTSRELNRACSMSLVTTNELRTLASLVLALGLPKDLAQGRP